MNRIAKHFDNIERPQYISGAEWSQDVTRSYWEGVEAGRKHERIMGAMRLSDVFVGFAMGAAVVLIAWRIFG